MNRHFVITGTDTDVGKTVFAAALTQALGATYWKPVQAGLADGSDSQSVAALSGCTVLPEAYRLSTPCSPDLAASLDGVTIDPARLTPPSTPGPLIVEGAGGALVPVNDATVYADLFARWGLPVIIVARTTLGTISHSLLTIEALRARGIPIHGIAFSGDAVAHSEETICRLGGVRHLGRLPVVAPLTPETLRTAFAQNFDLADFT